MTNILFNSLTLLVELNLSAFIYICWILSISDTISGRRVIFGSNLVENDGWMAFLDLSFKVFPGEGTPGFVFGFQAFSFCGKASIVLNITLTFYSIVLNITLTFVSKRFQFNAAQYLLDKIT